MKLRKANIIGFSYYHRFKKPNGNEYEKEISAEEYASLSKNGKPNNTDEWLHSYETYKFDSPSGKLEDGMYAQLQHDMGHCLADLDNFLVKIEGCEAEKVFKSYIDSSSEELLEAKKEEILHRYGNSN